MSFKNISADEIDGNIIKRIRDQWMLIAAGSEGNANSMIGSWGFMGEMWFKEVAICYVRPQRYTYQFMENNGTYSLNFLPEEYRSVLTEFGSNSGRDINKVEGGPLTPLYKNGTLYYAEADMVIFCKKLYAQDLAEESFIDPDLVEKCYKDRDFHRAYYGEIIEVLKK